MINTNNNNLITTQLKKKTQPVDVRTTVKIAVPHKVLEILGIKL